MPTLLNAAGVDPARDLPGMDLKQAVMDHFEQQKKFIPSKKPSIVTRSRWDIRFPFTPWEKIEALENSKH
jgi:hypothetical protein